MGADNDPLVNVPAFHVFLSMIPLVIIAAISYKMDLDLQNSIFIGLFRAFVQLSVLAYILHPIFFYGEEYWYIVVAYVFLMIVITTHEASQRVRYHFKGMFGKILISLLLNVATVCLFAFSIVVRPVPVPWEPQYVIPIAGMLLGNSINGVSLSINSLSTSLMEDKLEIELLLSFGANYFEASGRILRAAIRTGATPMLNSMAIIGLVSIPGMMTGQILAGSPVIQAAHYQMIIIFLIAVCTFGTILMLMYFTLNVGFDNILEVPRTDRLFKHQKKESIFATIGRLCGRLFKLCGNQRDSSSSDERKPLTDGDLESEGYNTQKPKGKIEIRTLRSNGKEKILKINEITTSFNFDESKKSKSSALFQNVSFDAGAGDIVLVDGPSGVGKSQFLRAIAGLNPLDNGTVSLDGKTFKALEGGMSNWRRLVRYVPQSKITIPGTPRDFIMQIAKFNNWKASSFASPTEEELIKSTYKLIQTFGLELSAVDKEWTTLSGGEAQRVTVAISLASKPKVLLMDECTSALDMNAKLIVEKAVKSYAKDFGITIFWITHDNEQKSRMGKKE